MYISSFYIVVVKFVIEIDHLKISLIKNLLNMEVRLTQSSSLFFYVVYVCNMYTLTFINK